MLRERMEFSACFRCWLFLSILPIETNVVGYTVILECFRLPDSVPARSGGPFEMRFTLFAPSVGVYATERALPPPGRVGYIGAASGDMLWVWPLSPPSSNNTLRATASLEMSSRAFVCSRGMLFHSVHSPHMATSPAYFEARERNAVCTTTRKRPPDQNLAWPGKLLRENSARLLYPMSFSV